MKHLNEFLFKIILVAFVVCGFKIVFIISDLVSVFF